MREPFPCALSSWSRVLSRPALLAHGRPLEPTQRRSHTSQPLTHCAPSFWPGAPPHLPTPPPPRQAMQEATQTAAAPQDAALPPPQRPNPASFPAGSMQRRFTVHYWKDAAPRKGNEAPPTTGQGQHQYLYEHGNGLFVVGMGTCPCGVVGHSRQNVNLPPLNPPCPQPHLQPRSTWPSKPASATAWA